MQKFRFGNPETVVEVSRNQYDADADARRPLYDCLCRGYGQNNKAPRGTYKVRATTPSAAARTAIEIYRKEYFGHE